MYIPGGCGFSGALEGFPDCMRNSRRLRVSPGFFIAEHNGKPMYQQLNGNPAWLGTCLQRSVRILPKFDGTFVVLQVGKLNELGNDTNAFISASANRGLSKRIGCTEFIHRTIYVNRCPGPGNLF